MNLISMFIEICFTGNFAGYSWTIIGIFILAFISLIKGTIKIGKGINEGNKFLSSFSGAGVGSRKENFEKINKNFKDNPDLNHAWNEFYECIVLEEEKYESNGIEETEKYYKNSRPAEDFFKFDEIVYNSSNWFLGIKFGVFETIPNILTGLGILGTFYGIISGLPSGITENSDHMLDGISVFLGGMKIAFGTSLLGLSLGILFNLIERCINDILEQKINKLAFKIDFLFIRKTEQSYLYSIMLSMESLVDLMTDMPKNMSESIASGFSKMGIEKDEVASSIKQGVKEGFEKLGESISQSVERQNEINETTERIVEEIKLISDSVVKTSELIKETQVNTGNITEKLSLLDHSLGKLSSELVPQIKQAVEANTIIQESINSLSESMKLGHSANESLRGEFEKITSSITGINTEFVEAYNSFQNLMSQSVKSSLEGFDKELGSSVSRLASIVSDMGDIGDEILTIHEEIGKKYSAPIPPVIPNP